LPPQHTAVFEGAVRRGDLGERVYRIDDGTQRSRGHQAGELVELLRGGIGAERTNPTGAVHGGSSDRRLAAAIPGARFDVIKNAGHLPQIEQPAALTELIAGFLKDN
jgi:pimeloyl-ACP methyl ester carboxylesterase